MLYIEIIFSGMASSNSLQNKRKEMTECEF